MEIRLSAHGSYHHQFHLVWIPKYRKRVIKGELKEFIKKNIFVIQEYHPDVEIKESAFQEDHVHLVVIIPPRYSVSEIVRKIKANTSREVRKNFLGSKKFISKMSSGPSDFFLRPLVSMKKLLKDMFNIRRRSIRANSN